MSLFYFSKLLVIDLKPVHKFLVIGINALQSGTYCTSKESIDDTNLKDLLKRGVVQDTNYFPLLIFLHTMTPPA